jgi:hypothetical protein
MCVVCVLCLIVVPLPPGETPFAVKINNNNNNNNKVGVKKVKFTLCFTNEALLHEGVWGSGCIDPYFLDLGSSWRWEVSGQLHSPAALTSGKESQVPIG